LWESYQTLSTTFSETTTEGGSSLLLAYKQMLLRKPQSTSADITLETTLWLRRMFDYQVHAIALRCTLKKFDGNNIKKLIQEFESCLLNQIDVNKIHIDESLIFESQDYINIQMEKIDIRMILNNSK
jgi:hypothetical protein